MPLRVVAIEHSSTTAQSPLTSEPVSAGCDPSAHTSTSDRERVVVSGSWHELAQVLRAPEKCRAYCPMPLAMMVSARRTPAATSCRSTVGSARAIYTSSIWPVRPGGRCQ